MRRTLVLLLAVLGLAGPACRSRTQEPAPEAPAPAAAAPGPASVKIWIDKTGVIELNGRIVELTDVGTALDPLVKQNGLVYFGQELAPGAPPANVAKVLKLVMDRGLDFRASADRGFSKLSPDHHYDKSYLGGGDH